MVPSLNAVATQEFGERVSLILINQSGTGRPRIAELIPELVSYFYCLRMVAFAQIFERTHPCKL